jgi:hypothetical protein
MCIKHIFLLSRWNHIHMFEPSYLNHISNEAHVKMNPLQVGVLGGCIGALSRFGHGSIFWFCIPLITSQDRDSEKSSELGFTTSVDGSGKGSEFRIPIGCGLSTTAATSGSNELHKADVVNDPIGQLKEKIFSNLLGQSDSELLPD